jgi:DNA-binding transcriptional MocR family regulator
MKYRQIFDYLMDGISKKYFSSGDKIPSIREMAVQFQCSKATVLRAYAELETNHIIYSAPKSGYFIVNNITFRAANNAVIDFAAMMPEAAVIPYTDFRACLNQALDIYQETSLMYNEKQGLPDLRTALAKQLQDYQIFERPENIYITAGAQQTIDILVRMPFPNGKNTILVEQPTYAGILRSLNLSGIAAIGITRNCNGIDLAQLERLFQTGNIKFFYTMPHCQNPTGTSYSTKEQEIILALANKYDVYIVEDDYLAEFTFDKKTDPLYAIDQTKHVLYIKSYSKACLPGLRLGALLLPPSFKTVFLQYKNCVDPYASSILQGALTMFIKNGMYAHHVKNLNNFYQPRITALRQACEKLPSSIIWHHAPHCCFVYLELPDKLNFHRLIANLHSKDVLIQDRNIWYLPNFEIRNGIRICVCQTSVEQINKGMGIFTNEINYWLNQQDRRHQFNDI